jgi:2-phosphosulfolactate phosphatase
MAHQHTVQVHLLPQLVPAGALGGATAVAIDVLRATTTMIAALSAGCTDIRPCATVDEARKLAAELDAGRVLKGGEQHNLKIEGFDLGNSPLEYTPTVCRGKTLVMTTTNGTRAVLRAAEADRAILAGFVNFSAVCDQLRNDPRPIHIVCSGTDGTITLEDALLAGAIVDDLSTQFDVRLNDSARLAWDAFNQQGSCPLTALQTSNGARGLIPLGHGPDIEFAAGVDRFDLVPELRRQPLRVEVGASGIASSHWKH